MTLTGRGDAADEYWRTDGDTTGTWISTFWNIGSATTTGGTGWTSGNNAVFTANSTLTFATSTIGNVTVSNGATVTITGGGTLTLGGVRTFDIGAGSLLTWISQPQSTAAGNEGAGIIKNGTGTLNWGAGPGTNVRYDGGFTLNAGTVIVSSNNSLSSGPLVINGGTLQSSGTTSFTSSSLAINADFTFAGTGNTTFSMATNLGAATRSINNTITAGSRILSGLISGGAGAGLTFTGSATGITYIGNAGNTFTGTITITSSEVGFASNGSFGDPNNTIVIDGGRLTGSTTSGGTANYAIASTHAIQVGASAGTAISVASAGTLTYNGVISDKSGATGAWAKQGTGTLVLSNVSTYSGDTAINAGALQLSTGTNRLPTGTTVSLGQALSTNLGTFDLNGFDQQIAGLNSITGTNATTSSNLVTSSSTAAILTLGGAGTYTFGDGTNVNSGAITLNVSLTKTGTGTQNLGGVNTYFGSTMVNGGILNVNGSIAAGSAVSINGGTLGGSGTVFGSISLNSGTIRPGVGLAGILKANDFVSFTSSSSNLGVRITNSDSSTQGASGRGSSSGVTLGNNNNVLQLTGSVNKTLALNSGMHIVIDGTGATFTNGTYSYIVAQAGTVTGLSTPITTPSQFSFTNLPADPNSFSLTTSGGNVYLNFTAVVPEPGTILGLSAAGLVLAGWIRRRRAK